ncbi:MULTISPECIES: DUF5709 domain-containing protein [unclassified Streptomyces]|uniref:DUF5709 domain-containing protein n=1 Tax=unclassified Streptomyces TaxID=2593676 RepID=UPI003659094E
MIGSDARGDDVHQPQAEAEPGESQPDMENALGEPDLDETLDTGYSPPDRPVAVTRHGTTGREQQAGETLDERLAQEEPEEEAMADDAHVIPWGNAAGDPAPGSEDMTGDPSDDATTAGRERAGRMAPTYEGPPVRHISVVARDAGIDGGAASAEEAAMHVVEQEPDEG